MQKNTKILVGFLGDSKGGATQYIINMIKHIDRNGIEFDLLTHCKTLSFEKELIELGCKVIVVPNKMNNRADYYRKLNDTIIEGQYDVVYIHKSTLSNIDILKIANKYRVKKVIVHAHSSKVEGNFITKVFHYINRELLKKYNIIKLACTNEAGNFMFGRDSKYKVIKNGIDLERFGYDKEASKELKNKLNISDKIVIGHMGRFVPLKNHKYLIELFKEINILNHNTQLLLCGDGPLREEIQKYSQELNVGECVTFTGNVDNPQDYLSTMDVFILPSLFEGAPLVAIEAMANGCDVYLSDTLTREINIDNYITYFSLQGDKKSMAKLILEKCKKKECKINNIESLKKNKFDINDSIETVRKVLV
ncbi:MULTISPECIES: glycosyltransferase [Clostridium]|uniref:glycosyltransferase n=1 Tax=Clostridium TaxID=1485 RepID=UPI00290930D9|nr:glycosyltransferase [Clostridium sp.]MDU4143108.1 glycosyltransferase [Clostridium sp.]